MRWPNDSSSQLCEYVAKLCVVGAARCKSGAISFSESLDEGIAALAANSPRGISQLPLRSVATIKERVRAFIVGDSHRRVWEQRDESLEAFEKRFEAEAKALHPDDER